MKIIYLEWKQCLMQLTTKLVAIITCTEIIMTIIACFIISLIISEPALAELRLCNKTMSRVGIAVGYRDNPDWITEGWWNIPPNKCELIFSGDLTARYYYIHAIDYDRGGEWGGKSYMCIKDKAFTFRGINNCSKSGFKQTGFTEIDTQNAKDWTVRLTYPDTDTDADADADADTLQIQQGIDVQIP